MSEKDTRLESPEDKLILELLDSARPDALVREPSDSAEDLPVDKLRRDYLEVLGTLPSTQPSVVPPADLKHRVMKIATGSEDTSAAGLDAFGPSSSFGRALPTEPAPHRWWLPLAASIAFGVMIVTGWLVIRVQEQQGQIVELSAALEEARVKTATLLQSQGDALELRSRLSLVTSPGSEFCALRPTESALASGQGAKARGTVVMHPADEDWFLRVEGLAPCPEGRKYALWFVTGERVVAGPVFDVKTPQEPVEIAGGERPDGITAIMITLESDSAPTAPSTEPVLYGDERMQVL